MAREIENHIDHPRRFMAWTCALCRACHLHVETHRCIHGGPFATLPQPITERSE
jgi:hypothetical protein